MQTIGNRIREIKNFKAILSDRQDSRRTIQQILPRRKRRPNLRREDAEDDRRPRR